MMKKIHVMAWMAGILLLMQTGCIRMMCDQEFQHPSKRMYRGTKLSLYLGHEYVLPYAAVPFEAIADTILLPYDWALYANYRKTLPLNDYILESNLEGLATRLAQGADPNFVDERCDKPQLPVLDALRCHSLKAYELLVSHGATVPVDMVKSYMTDDEPLVLAACQTHWPQEVIDREGKGVVLSWLWRNRNGDEAELQRLLSILTTLINKGFPVNDCMQESGHWLTALDVVNKTERLSPDYRANLSALLTEHGALSFTDVLSTSQDLPRSHVEGKVDSMFQPVMDVLSSSTVAEQLYVSTNYPDIDGPVAVIDFMPKQSETCRQTIQLHRRLTPSRWNQQGEPFEVPTAWRMIATPSGRPLPSRLTDDVPAGAVMYESWYTLPCCEVYVEMAPCIGGDNLVDDIRRMAVHKVEPQRPYRHDEDWLLKLRSNQDRWFSWDFTDKPKGWLAAANKRMAVEGMAQTWRALTDREHTWFVYSTHRDCARVTRDELPIAPYADEIIAIAETDTDITEDRFQQYLEGQQGISYWNCREYRIKEVGCITLLFGDEASDNALFAMYDRVLRLLRQ